MAAWSGGQFLPPKRNDSRSTKSGKKNSRCHGKNLTVWHAGSTWATNLALQMRGSRATLPPAIFLYLYFYLNGVETLYCYTLSHRGPSHHELGSWGLGWTCGTSGRPSKIVVTAFSSGNAVASLPSGSSSGLVLQVRDPEVMELRIMPQSLSLCLTG
jgi:hypothetical protein